MSIYGNSILHEGIIIDIKINKKIVNWADHATKVVYKIKPKMATEILKEIKELVDEYNANLAEWQKSKSWDFYYKHYDIPYLYKKLNEALKENKNNVNTKSSTATKDIDPNKLASDIKGIENKLYSDDSFIDFVEKLARKGMKDFDLDVKDFSPHIKDHELVPKLVSEYEGEEYIVVIDHSQDVRIAMCGILNKIIEELNKMPKYKSISFHTGDGDEGCIYW